MRYRDELHFLCDTLKKSRIRAVVASPQEVADLPAGFRPDATLGELLPAHSAYRAPQERTLYQSKDAFGFCYRYLLLPEITPPTLLFIGPYLSAPYTPRQLLELGERNGVSPKRQRHLEEYCESIPVLGEDNHLFVMLHTFCERLWKSPAFAMVDETGREPLPAVLPYDEQGEGFEDILVSIQAMETRYAFENEIIRAVTLGQIHKEGLLLSAFSDRAFEQRLSDPVRNAKNYAIIMNTLLRKAAEQGGVHPVYLDRISSAFAKRIEQMTYLSENTALMRDMFRSYCRLVRRHSLRHLSPVVQKTVLLIDSDLSADLSLRPLAARQGVSAGYLCTVFKKETGKTVSEYVREQRIRLATHLLQSTKLQIQTVALHCGVMDVQYFSKLFKRHTGKTPKEYRDTAAQTEG